MAKDKGDKDSGKWAKGSGKSSRYDKDKGDKDKWAPAKDSKDRGRWDKDHGKGKR